MVNPAADQYFQDNFYFITTSDAGKSDSKAKILLCSTHYKVKILSIQTLQDCLNKLKNYSKILFDTFTFLSFRYVKFKRSLPEKLCQV